MGKQLVSMTDLEAKFLGDVEDTTARLNKAAGNTIGIRNSKFTYKQELIGRTINVVIADFVHAQTWYLEKFDPENPSPPTCHALSVSGDEMQPLASSPDKQADFCDGCEKNAWGSADVGRGKACGQQYKAAVLAAGPGETLASCDMAILTIPPTSLKNFDAYVKSVAKSHGRPPYAVITHLSFDEDAEHPVLMFEVDTVISNVQDANDIMGRLEDARELLLTPPDFSANVAPTKKKTSKKTKKKVTKKKVAKKKATKKKATKKKASKKAAPKKRGKSKFS